MLGFYGSERLKNLRRFSWNLTSVGCAVRGLCFFFKERQSDALNSLLYIVFVGDEEPLWSSDFHLFITVFGEIFEPFFRR